jgi:hypothetical protein
VERGIRASVKKKKEFDESFYCLMGKEIYTVCKGKFTIKIQS